MTSDDLKRSRALFPFLEKGVVYLDHASIGPLPLSSHKAVGSYLEQRSGADAGLFREFLNIHAETKQRIGKLIHAPANRIAFCDNTSNGLNILATGLDWKTGDRIILTDVEFPANVYPFLNQKRHGVEIDFVHCRENKVFVADIERLITPRTKIISISHVQFLHGYRADLAAIGELCRHRGIIFCVDAIQAAGVVPVDVEAMKIDFLSCGSQKWLLGIEGIAFIYVSEETQKRIQQAYMGWLSISDFFSDFFRYRLDFDPTARRYEGGTLNVAGIVALNASLGLLLDAGIENIGGRVEDLTRFCYERIMQEDVEVMTPSLPRERAGIVSFRPDNARSMFERLREENIFVSLREKCIRFSPHFYNTREEVAKALEIAFT